MSDKLREAIESLVDEWAHEGVTAENHYIEGKNDQRQICMREVMAILAALRDADGWVCTHCGKRWDGPEEPGERRHWVDGVSEFDESHLCGPVVPLPEPPKEE